MPRGDKVLVCWPSDYLQRSQSVTIAMETGLYWHGDLIVFKLLPDSNVCTPMSISQDGPMAWEAIR